MSDRWERFDADGGQSRSIPAITLWQPWASLIALGAKQIETRSWNLRYRGPLAIHAAMYRGALGVAYNVEAIRRVLKANRIEPRSLPFGKVLCLAEVDRVDVIDAELRARTSNREQWYGNFADGRYAWHFARVAPLDEPLTAIGHQGLWRWECPISLLRTFTTPAPSGSSSS